MGSPQKKSSIRKASLGQLVAEVQSGATKATAEVKIIIEAINGVPVYPACLGKVTVPGRPGVLRMCNAKVVPIPTPQSYGSSSSSSAAAAAASPTSTEVTADTEHNFKCTKVSSHVKPRYMPRFLIRLVGKDASEAKLDTAAFIMYEMTLFEEAGAVLFGMTGHDYAKLADNDEEAALALIKNIEESKAEFDFIATVKKNGDFPPSIVLDAPANTAQV